jgi:hypothetical protein
MENNSQNKPKAKRGRPKSWEREIADSLPSALRKHGCERTEMNSIYACKWMAIFTGLTPDEQRDLCGSTSEEQVAGKAKPRRWETAAVEIGRYLVAVGETEANEAEVVRIVRKARIEGIKWGIIGKHFRKLRLGKRQGNEHSLFACLARAFDDYCEMFPATTQEDKEEAIRRLLETVESMDE